MVDAIYEFEASQITALWVFKNEDIDILTQNVFKNL